MKSPKLRSSAQATPSCLHPRALKPLKLSSAAKRGRSRRSPSSPAGGAPLHLVFDKHGVGRGAAPSSLRIVAKPCFVAEEIMKALTDRRLVDKKEGGEAGLGLRTWELLLLKLW